MVDSRLSVVPGASTLPTRTLWASQVTSDRKQLAAGMTATLSAELDDRVTLEFIADIVRAVLDESRRDVHEELAEYVMFEARQRLGRFVRARAAR